MIILIPVVDKMVKVSLRLLVLDVDSQDVITRDNVSVKVNAVIYFRVIDSVKAIIELVLTLGFARRFATYKRALLIFQDLINLARDPQLGGRIAFVEDYGEQLAQYLVHGVDIWLNNPLPPSEACGTSGMKAGLNGVPHLSILDGWWVEGFNGKNGWAVEHDPSSTSPDGSDAEKIYRILEDEIIPLYYKTSESGVPQDWVKAMKAAMKSNAARFSARRMVKEYIEKFYSKGMR